MSPSPTLSPVLRLALVALALLFAPRAVRAQAACAHAAEVEALEAEALRLNRANDPEAARATYLRAFELCHEPRTQGRVAITLIALGRWVEAETWIQDTLTHTTDPWVSANIDRLRQQAGLIDDHLGDLLVVGDGTTGAVLVDGQRVASFPMRDAVRAVAGQVTVRVERPDQAPVIRSETIVARQLTRVEIAAPPPPPQQQTPQPQPTQRRPPPPRPRRSSTLHRVLAWSAAGVGAVGLGVGVWATVESFDRRATYDRLCAAHQWLPTRTGECGADGTLLRPVWAADVVVPQVLGFVAGGVLAAASVVLFVTAPSGDAGGARAWLCAPTVDAPGFGCVTRF